MMMEPETKFVWPARKEICAQQVMLCKRLPTDTLVDGIPILEHWEQELAEAHKHTATFDEMLDELATWNDSLTLHEAHEKIKDFYGKEKYDAFSKWLDRGSIGDSNSN